MNNKLDEKLFEYADYFDENFPTFAFAQYTAAEIIQIIDDCIAKKKKVEYDQQDKIY